MNKKEKQLLFCTRMAGFYLTQAEKLEKELGLEKVPHFIRKIKSAL